MGQVKKYLEDNFEFELSDYDYDKFSDFIRSFNEFKVDGTYIILEKPKIDARQLKQDTRLMNMLRNAISDCADDDNWANIGKVNRYLINNHDFDCQSYGYDKIGDFFKAINLFYVDRNWVSIKKVIDKKPINEKTNKTNHIKNNEYFNDDDDEYSEQISWSEFMSDITGIKGDWDWYDD